MASELVVGLVFRVLLPLSLTAACVFRYNVFSLVYLLLLLLLPLVPEPTATSIKGNAGWCLKAVCASSLLFLLFQSFFQVTTATLQLGYNCSSWEKALGQMGLPQQEAEEVQQEERLEEEQEVLMFEEGEEQEQQEDEEEQQENEDSRHKILVELELLVSKTRQVVGNMITTGRKVLVTGLLGVAGIMFPSLSSLLYLLSFQVLCTWWAWSGQVPPLLFRCVCVCSLLYSSSHLLLLYCYQLPSMQESIPPNSSYARVFGLVSVVSVDCAAPWRLEVNSSLSWFHFSSPLLLLLLYYTVATLWRKQVLVFSTNDSPPDYSFAPPTQNAALGLELYSTPHYSLSQSDTVETNEFDADGCGWEEEEEEEETRREEGVSAASMAFRFLLKQSYICALIAMMGWSITYVSWLTCVLLLWSCVLWMMRERRRYTLLSSPWLVAYGNLLVVLQYIYSFPDANEVPGLFLKKEVPCKELASKLVCLLTFWLLLRQALTEKRDRKKDRQADTHLSTITVHSKENQKEEEDNELCYEEVLFLGGGGGMQALVVVVTRMFVKYWIYICGTMFFFVSFEGRIVLYKVIYMVMFLCCVALYQLNYERWRVLLRGFWVAVVVYSMLVLILVYTFQFPSSPDTWSYYTGLSTHRLEDLGLEKFSVPVLFTRICIPAAFLLVCILHLHYFHEPFLQLTDLKTVVDTHNSTITRLVHSEGSLVDLSLVGPPHVPLEEERRGEEREREEDEVEEEVEEEEEKEEEYPCMFDRETPSDQITALVSWRLVVDRLSVLFLHLLLSLQRLQRLLWWLLELHIIKIVSSYILWVSVKEVCLFNLVFVVCVGVALPCRVWRPLLAGVCTVWTCVVTVCKMLYQLNAVQPHQYSSNCSMPGNSSSELSGSVLYSGPIDPAQWVGLRKTDGKLLDYVRYNLVMLALLALEVTIYRHQELYRLRGNVVPPPTRSLFNDITRQHLDDGLLNCAKYFVNYFFYKFGLETCFLLAINVIGQRMDLFAVGHAFGLITILSRRNRKRIAQIWPKYCYFLLGLLCFQYLLCIGFPPAACRDYPWRFPSSNMDSNVVKWLFLPDHLTPPNPLFLLYDFMLLLGASLQLQVFEEEVQLSYQILAGDNRELDDDGQTSDPIRRFRLNTVPDFMLCRSYLDMMKVIMFSYMFWFVLTVIFITGTTRISIFCMGYLVACFYFLLVGGDLLLKPVKSILVYWDCLIGYNIFVITMKNILSILACGFIKSLVLNHCWLIQVFSLACTIKGYTKPEQQQSSKQCELPSDEAGIAWDGVCFCFLLLQRRVFRSQYFMYVVLDLRNTQLLASRGAELFEASTVKAVRARLEVEKNSMDLLKRQMERIKSRQQKFRRGKEKLLSLTQDSTHTDGQQNRKGRSQKEWWRPWVDHASMVRSGNYYLFETDSEEEEEEEKNDEEEKGEELSEKSAFQFVYHAWITDSRTAMKARSNEQKLWNKHSSGQKSRREEKGAAESIEVEEEREEREEGEEEREDGPDTGLRRFSNMLRFCWVLLSALLDSLTAWLNGLCQEHVHISTVLRIEHCMLTQQAKQGNVPSREAIHVYYQQQMLKTSRESGLDYSSHEAEGEADIPPSYSLALGLDLQEEREDRGGGEGSSGSFRKQLFEKKSDFLSEPASTSCPLPPRTQELTASDLLRTRTFYDEELEASDHFYGNQPQLLQLCYALYNILAARSETVCYLVIVLNHMVSASCLTLVLPVLVFLWAMLSVPRPSKTFWMTAIIYTEVTIVMKYFFQFGFFPFNQMLELERSKPFHPPNILGVEKKDGYVLYDLLQLLALFYHRAILKCHGLWDQTETMDTNMPCRHDNQSDSSPCPSHIEQLDSATHNALRRRSGRQTRSSSTRLHSPTGSVCSSVKPTSRTDLLLEKLREVFIRAKKLTVSRCMSVYHPVCQFFRALVQPEYSAVTDVYVLMFLTDTVDFIIIVFGFWAFGKHSAAADITSSLSEDQVPEAFLVMVLIQFGTMVIDRALYLRKTVLGKLVFQVILVFGIHFWMFFILPTVTERRFNQNLVAQLWYFVKCVYFGLSAYQIRSGYPTRVLGNFLTKSHNYLNLFLFQGFRMVPFLTELRAVMDWVWTDTTLSLSSWICVEDVYAHSFVLKCWRESERRYPQPRGQKKKRVVKYGMGGLIVVLLICIVWFPLLFMSLVKSVAGVVNRPLDVSLTITLGGFQPIFTMSAQQNQLKEFSDEDFSSFISTYSYTPSALQFLEAYTREDVTLAELQGSSNSLWTISPPSRQYLTQVLNLEHFPLTVSWTIQRNLSLGAKAELASGKHVTFLDDQTRLDLIQLLNGTRTLPVVIQEVFPCFIRAPSDSNAKPIDQLYTDNYKDILLALERSTNQSQEIQEWWIVDQPAASLVPMSDMTSVTDRREAGLQLFVFSDKVSPPSLGFLAGYGIMGLYASVVLVIGKFVREFFSGISHSIMFEELPCVDRILKLCTDIFLVRETGELELEEELYAKLIFLYRSPETLIKWTRR
ncbi:piezo-type mechanosensitive ion channel component 2-like [Diretmus argenteus]